MNDTGFFYFNLFYSFFSYLFKQMYLLLPIFVIKFYLIVCTFLNNLPFVYNFIIINNFVCFMK